jgi:septum site-determining protein MinC
MTEHVVIKGARGGVRVIINEACTWADAVAELQQQLSLSTALLDGMKVAIDIGARHLSDSDVQSLQRMTEVHHVSAFELQSDSREVRQIARGMGVIARPVGLRAEARAPESTAGIIIRNLRNGQVLRHHGDLTLLGDVNAGAELVASGSIVVFGRVRGFVHAGAAGNRQAIICAIDLSAPQLRIADIRARAPEEQGDKVPEIACVEDDRIVVRVWEEYRR